MKNITWTEVRTTVKGWQVGDYIPEDSLIQFCFLMGHIRSFYYSQNAFHTGLCSTCGKTYGRGNTST